MTDKDDQHIATLYRQSSQEEPPARLDHAVLEQARKAARTRPASTLGAAWVAAGTLAMIGIIGVILVSLWQDRQVLVAPPVMLEEAAVPRDDDTDAKEAGDAPAEVGSRREQQPAVTEKSLPPRPDSSQRQQMDSFYGKQTGAARERAAAPSFGAAGEAAMDGLVASPVPLPEITAPDMAAGYWLETIRFGEQAAALALQTRLRSLDLPVELRETGAAPDPEWQVLVGPLADTAAVERARGVLDDLGIPSRILDNGQQTADN